MRLLIRLFLFALALPVAAQTPVTVQLDWVAEPEHGGFYQAQAKGFFRDAGLAVTLLQGGPNAHATQKVATSRAHLAQAESTNTLFAINEGLPLLCVATVFQDDPSVLMLHADNPVRTFADLNGKTIMARPEWALLPYLRKKYGIDFKIIPQNYSVANFVADPNFIQQGYYIAEPFHIMRGGAKPPKFLYSWDSGYDACAVLIAHPKWARENRDTLRAFLAAYIRGWEDYLTGDPAPAHALMKKENANNTDAFLAFSREQIIREKLVVGRTATDSSQIGRVSAERFANQIQQLESLGLLPSNKLTPARVMSADYLPAAPAAPAPKTQP